MIRVIDDLAAPALVWGIDYGTSKADEGSAADAFKWNKPAGIGVCALGYILGGWLGYGGNFLKNMGIASFPWALNSISSYVSGISGAPVRSRAGVASRIRGYPAQPKDTGVAWPRAV